VQLLERCNGSPICLSRRFGFVTNFPADDPRPPARPRLRVRQAAELGGREAARNPWVSYPHIPEKSANDRHSIMCAAVIRKQCMPDQERQPPRRGFYLSARNQKGQHTDRSGYGDAGPADRRGADPGSGRGRTGSDRPDHRSRAVHQSGGGHHNHSGRGGNCRCRAAVSSQGRDPGATCEHKGAASGDRGAPRTGSCDHSGGGWQSVPVGSPHTALNLNNT